MAAEVLNLSLVLRLNFGAKLNFSVNNLPHRQAENRYQQA